MVLTYSPPRGAPLWGGEISAVPMRYTSFSLLARNKCDIPLSSGAICASHVRLHFAPQGRLYALICALCQKGDRLRTSVARTERGFFVHDNRGVPLSQKPPFSLRSNQAPFTKGARSPCGSIVESAIPLSTFHFHHASLVQGKMGRRWWRRDSKSLVRLKSRLNPLNTLPCSCSPLTLAIASTRGAQFWMLPLQRVQGRLRLYRGIRNSTFHFPLFHHAPLRGANGMGKASFCFVLPYGHNSLRGENRMQESAF